MKHDSTRILPVLLTTLALLIGQGPANGAEPDEITGQVLDAEGQPVAGIEVSPSWFSEKGRWTARSGKRTDAEGRFAFNTRQVSGRLMTLDATQEHGAVETFDAQGTKKPLVLKLRPTTLVQASYTNQDLGHEIEKLYAAFRTQGTKYAVAAHQGAPTFGLRLPPGDYSLTAGGVDCQRTTKSITIPADKDTFDLGTTDLKPTVIARYYGKEPPAWNVTDARGVDAKATLADFKGKWVLLEFWGYW